MCGICGAIRFDGRETSLTVLEAMLRKLTNRGPDAMGTLVQKNIGFGHRRLKIIDLSEHSRQPMSDADLGLDIVTIIGN